MTKFRRRAGLLATLIVLVAAGAAYSRQSGAVRRTIGVNAYPENSTDLAAIKQLGLRQIRWTLYWGNYLDTRQFAADRSTPVTSGGQTVAQTFAAAYRAAAAAHLDQLIVVHSPPAGMTLQQGMTAMPAFMAARARDFPGTTWQILNEQDSEDAFNNGWFQAKVSKVTQYQRGGSYGALLSAVATAIHAADPSARVVSGGTGFDPADFLRGMLETCDPKLLTAVAVHAYGQPNLIQVRSKGIAAKAVSKGLPVWLTEFGSRVPTETLQRADLAAVLDDYDTNHRYERAYLYSLSSPDGYGVLSAHGVLRSAASLLTNRTAP